MGQWMLNVRKLQYWWRGFNDAVFGGELRPIKIVHGWTGRGVWGWCTSDREIIISDKLDEDQAMSTLLHEMIHQWQLEHGLEMSHGASFLKWSKTCKSLTGLQVHWRG